MDPSLYAVHKALFSKSWPKGANPSMKGFDYYNNKFIHITGYNWWLLPCVDSTGAPQYMGTFHGGDMTMKFTLGLPFTSTKIVSTTPRIGVLVETSDSLYHVYVDEDANLFIDTESDVCVGKVTVLSIRMWDGSVSLDVDTIRRVYPSTIGQPHDWYLY